MSYPSDEIGSAAARRPRSVPSRLARGVVVPWCLATMLTGCFTYAPVGNAPLRQGADVRALLQEPTTVPVPTGTISGVSRVDGWLIGAPADSVFLSARWLRSTTGQEFPGAGSTLRIPRSNVSLLQTRRFDTLRTALLVGAAAVALGSIGAAADLGGGKNDGTGTGGGQTQ
jgi:hypothetical protein